MYLAMFSDGEITHHLVYDIRLEHSFGTGLCAPAFREDVPLPSKVVLNYG